MRFSEKMGATPFKSTMQIDSIDGRLRNKIWNAFLLYFFDSSNGSVDEQERRRIFCIKSLWIDFFVNPVDEIPVRRGNIDVRGSLNVIRNKYFSMPWYEIYDFVEFISTISRTLNNGYTSKINKGLEEEQSAYRLIKNVITRITSEVEIEEVEEAMNISNVFKSVNIHLKLALEYLSNRDNPDYRNSIKESISAVEAMCKTLANDNEATLGTALSILEKQHNLHPTLKHTFSTLYGYTSNAGGIRHSLKDGDTEIDFDEAKFMLVACSAFVNYLKVKLPFTAL